MSNMSLSFKTFLLTALALSIMMIFAYCALEISSNLYDIANPDTFNSFV